LGLSRSTYYRRCTKARQEAALAQVMASKEAVLDRLQWQIESLRANLDKIVVAERSY
jgi:hypothetical protein